MKRLFCLLILLLAATATPARADKLILIPTAELTPLRAEWLWRVDGGNANVGTLQVPAGRTFEVLVRHYRDLGRDDDTEFGGQFQFIPEGLGLPAVSVGIWDVTNSSPYGRRAFIVLTKTLEGGELFLPAGFPRTQLHAGIGTSRFSPGFLGVEFFLPANLSLAAEYDGRRANFGARWRPVRFLSLKGELWNGEPFVGGQVSRPF